MNHLCDFEIGSSLPPVRYVILHLPGPGWLPGRTAFAQPGVTEHVAYLQRAFAAGMIELAGPFLIDGTGGMVVMRQSCSEQDARRLVDDDPGVRSGLIRAEVRPWMTTLAVGMESSQPPEALA